MQLSLWQGQAEVGGDGGPLETTLPTTASQNEESLWLLPRMTEEILKLKQEWCARISHSSVISGFFPYLAGMYVF